MGRAPSWEGGKAGGEEEEGEERLMVRVEGCEVLRGQEDDGGRVEGLLGLVERRMGELRRVVEAGGCDGDGAGGDVVRGGEEEGEGEDFEKEWIERGG